MQIVHFHGKKAVRSTDQRVEGVGKFILWRLEQLKKLHEAGAPAEERERFKQGLLATLSGIYARKDGWTAKDNVPYNVYWDIVDYHLFQEGYSPSKPLGHDKDVLCLLDQHNKAYQQIFAKEFHKLMGRPERPMQ